MLMYCVGCGSSVCHVEPGQFIAITCAACGAMSPVLVNDTGTSFAPPYSLIRAVARGEQETPHLEYYFGYSDHESAVKTAMVSRLKEHGFISQLECDKQSCRDAHAEALERNGDSLERLKRIQEIGEP